MKMHVYEPGGENSPTVLIIHPMLSSASSMKVALCDHMGPGLRFLVPDLSAHGDEASAPYVSAASEAAAIHEWLASRGLSRLSLGFGASLGGVILFELLRFPDLSFDRLFIEGVSFSSGGPVARVGGAILSRVMVAKHRKAVRDPEAGARKLARLYGEEAARSMVASFAAISEDSIRAIVHDCSHVSLPPLSPRHPAALHLRVRGDRLGPAARAPHDPSPLSGGRTARLARLGALRAQEPRRGHLRGDAAERRPGLGIY